MKCYTRGIFLTILFIVSINVYSDACLLSFKMGPFAEKSCWENHGMRKDDFKQKCKNKNRQKNMKVSNLIKCPLAGALAYCKELHSKGTIYAYVYSKINLETYKMLCTGGVNGRPKGSWHKVK